MIYEYKNEDTGEIVEEDFPMNEEIPVTIYKDGKEYRRVFNASTHIPEGWGENKLDFSKPPSRRKHYW